MKEIKSQGFVIRMNGLIGFIFLVLVLAALYFIAKSLFTTLWWIGPIMFAAALLINYKTVLNYFRFMLGLLKRSALAGILGIVLSVLGFPILSGFLLVRALLARKVKSLREGFQSREKDEFVEFEEVERKDKKLDLPSMEKDPSKSKDNQYEGLF